MLTIGNAQGFWGDRPAAPAEMLEKMPELNVLTLEYLAEVSLSIMAVQREKDPSLGYARDLLEAIRTLIPYWQKGGRCKLVTNGGGLNPHGCALEVKKLLEEAGLTRKIAIVEGDDVLGRIENAPHPLITANAYLGAQSIAEALKQGADIVITGRVADPSLTVGPCIAHFGWSLNEYDKIAQATVAGHLIECGTQVTGGISTHWMSVSDVESIGFPVIEMKESGEFVITKPPGTGGEVTERTVKEQLLYEIGDPGAMLTPDCTLSLHSLALHQESPNRIRITGAKGSAPPENYKISCTYRDGYRAEGMLLITGDNAAEKAYRAGEILLSRVEKQGHSLQRTRIEALGNGDAFLGTLARPQNLTECVLRVAAADPDPEALQCFVKEFAPLVTSGPQGTTGYITGRPKIRPVFGFWPAFLPRKTVTPRSRIL